MGVLASVSAHAGPSAQPPMGTSRIFPAHVSAEQPSNISPFLSHIHGPLFSIFRHMNTKAIDQPLRVLKKRSTLSRLNQKVYSKVWVKIDIIILLHNR